MTFLLCESAHAAVYNKVEIDKSSGFTGLASSAQLPAEEKAEDNQP